MVRTPDAFWGNLAVETVVTEWRSGAIRWLHIVSRSAWIGMPIAEMIPVERSIPMAWIAAAALTS
jgi:hypothetical protein